MSSLGIYKGAKVVVTGHTGFKGSWLIAWLKQLGAIVSGVSIDIPSEPSHFNSAKLYDQVDDYRIDIRDNAELKLILEKIQPDFVFHLAAQALVRPSYNLPLDTITTNAIGSVNVLDVLHTLDKPVVAVMITSDKVYDNVEWVWGYREVDRLGGKDPYSASKGMAELAIRSYVESFFNATDSNVRIGIARAGNVIGGGDWAIDRIVPDCIKAWSRNEIVDIRSPNATRPWQHVLEPLSGYLTLGALLSEDYNKHGEAYNFGPEANQNHPVSKLIDEMANYWSKVRWNDVSKSQDYLHEAGLLKLNCDKALFEMNWRSTMGFEETVRMTVEWYKAFYENKETNMYDFSMKQIIEYTNLARDKGIEWASKKI
jgi:CDP-glucose 4,6-dehydratase